MRIFLSYSNRDNKIATQVKATLQSFGIECQVEDGSTIPVGSDLRRAIPEAIRQSSALVVILGDDPRSQWVDYEVGVAQAFGKRVIVVQVGSGTTKSGTLSDIQPIELGHLPEFLAHLQGTTPIAA